MSAKSIFEKCKWIVITCKTGHLYSNLNAIGQEIDQA